MFNKPISSLLPAENHAGCGLHFEVPRLDVRNPVPGTATFPGIKGRKVTGIKGEKFPYEEKPDFIDKNKDHLPDPPRVKSLSTKPHKTRVPRTYW